MRRKKGPCKTEQWSEALKGPLTGEKVEYLKRGKLGKCDYKTLLSEIGDCVTDNLNDALSRFEEGSDDPVEILYRLGLLTDTVRNVCFFRCLGFIEKSDGDKLTAYIKNAVGNFVRQIEIPVEHESADLVYRICALKNEAGLTD